MRYRVLPIVQKIQALAETDPAAAKHFQDALVLDLFKLPGFQLVMAAIQLVEGEAIAAIRDNATTQTERMAGRIQAANMIRHQLLALLPDGTTLEEDEPEEEAEYEPLYDSGFAVPLPSGE